MSTPSYWVAIAEPGNVIASATSTSITFTGLTANTSYLVTVFGIYGNNACTGPSTLTVTTANGTANITDFGMTTTLIATPSTFSIDGDIVRMSKDGKYGIMISSTTTLYISSDYCNTWTQVTKPNANASYRVAMCGTGQYCILPFYNGGGVWYSTNYGATWTQSNASTATNWGTAVSNEAGDRWIMSCGNSNNGLYYSTNYGATWTQSNITSNGWYIAMSKTGDKAIAVINHGTSSVNIWIYSTNYGQTWTTSSSNVTGLGTYNAFAPGNGILTMSDDGVYCVSPGLDYNTQTGISGVWYSTNSGVTWNVSTMTSAPSALEWCFAVSDSTGQYVVVMPISYGWGTNKGIWISTNYGVTFNKTSYFTTNSGSGLAASRNLQYFSLVTGGRIYYGTNPFASAPSAPTAVTATVVSSTSVSVAFTPPAGTVTSYTVTSTPGSFTGTGSASPITVTGLTASTAYTFTVTATNSNGTSPASTASTSVTTSTVSTASTSISGLTDPIMLFNFATSSYTNNGSVGGTGTNTGCTLYSTGSSAPTAGSTIPITGSGCIYFPGNSGTFTIPSFTLTTSGITIAFWYYNVTSLYTYSSNYSPVVFSGTPGNIQYYYQIPEKVFHLNPNSGSASDHNSSTALWAANSWQHVVVAASSSSVVFYSNGATANGTTSAPGSTLPSSGSMTSNVMQNLAGYVCDFRVYNYQLNQTQVTSLYNKRTL